MVNKIGGFTVNRPSRLNPVQIYRDALSCGILNRLFGCYLSPGWYWGEPYHRGQQAPRYPVPAIREGWEPVYNLSTGEYSLMHWHQEAYHE